MSPAAPASAGTPSAQAGNLIDPRTLMSIKNLEMRAKVVVEGFWNGLHRSPYHGFSVEFSEYRQYSEGDDPRYVDWKLFGRSDRFYIKKFEDETNLRCHLLVDGSRSMEFGTAGWSKSAYANTLAATLAYFLFLQGDAIGLLRFDETVREYLPARHRRAHLRQLMLALEKPAAGRDTDLAMPLRRIVELVRKRGVIILISDLLAPLEALTSNLAQIRAWGHEMIVFQILDPRELDFEFADASMFFDLETGRDLYIDPAAARKEYLRKFTAHNAGIQGACQKLGITFHRLLTDRPLEFALFDFLRSRMEGGKKLKRLI